MLRGSAVLAALWLGAGAAAAQEAPRPAPSPSPRPEGRTLLDTPGGSLILVNRAQFRWTHEMPDDALQLPGTPGPGADRGSFRVRRAKTELHGWIWRKRLTYELQLSWAGPEPGASTTSPLQDLILTYDVSGDQALQVTVGQFKVPLGRQEMTSSQRLQFLDRDILSTEFTRGRDVGVQLEGVLARGRLAYWAGVFNGNPASRLDNDNDRYQWNARVSWQPWGDVRYSESDFESVGRPLLAVAGQLEKNDLHGATNADDLDTRTLGGDVVFKYRGLSAFLEYFDRRRTPETAPAFSSDGYHAQAGYFLVRHRWEVAARYARYDPSDRIPDNDRSERGAVVSLFLDRHLVKLQADVRQIDDEGRDTRHRELRVQAQVVF